MYLNMGPCGDRRLMRKQPYLLIDPLPAQYNTKNYNNKKSFIIIKLQQDNEQNLKTTNLSIAI
jgi:hypothetical protein